MSFTNVIIPGSLGTTVESSEITNGEIVNADINASAAIVASKLAIGSLAATVYSPVRSAEVNITSTVTMTEAQYMRVGNTVLVSGRFTATATTTTLTTSFEMTLPVASDIGAAEDVAGTAFCGAIASMGAEVIGVAANDTAKVQWKATDVTAQTWSYIFAYQVI